MNQIKTSIQSIKNTSEDSTFFKDQNIIKLENNLINLEKIKNNLILEINNNLNNQKIEDLEKLMIELRDKYNNININKSKQKQLEPELDEKKEITNLLFNYFKGNEKEIEKIALIFEWTEIEKENLSNENLSFWNKSTKLFQNFRDIWTNWLINAAEN